VAKRSKGPEGTQTAANPPTSKAKSKTGKQIFWFALNIILMFLIFVGAVGWLHAFTNWIETVSGLLTVFGIVAGTGLFFKVLTKLFKKFERKVGPEACCSSPSLLAYLVAFLF
jgi:membrane protein YdbS with pleckstrin-like domain